jgi:hypothetical protein
MTEGQPQNEKTRKQIEQECDIISQLLTSLSDFVRDKDKAVVFELKRIEQSFDDYYLLYSRNQMTPELILAKAKELLVDAKRIVINTGIPPEALSEDKLRSHFEMIYNQGKFNKPEDLN